MKQNEVLVKWKGSKRLQAERILFHFPKETDTYYEPFLGGASVLYEAIKNKAAKKYRASDHNKPLIEIWKLVQNDPNRLFEDYTIRWHKLQSKGKDYYYETRSEFNKDQDPLKFFFLLRTCRNGLVRYNKKGEFNSGFHLRRSGIRPQNLKSILNQWNCEFGKVDIKFEVKDYQKVNAKSGDFLYLDPPYVSKEVYYYGDFNINLLFDWLRSLKCNYALSLNGSENGIDKTIDVPIDLYTKHVFIENGFQRLADSKVEVKHSLYVRNHVS